MKNHIKPYLLLFLLFFSAQGFGYSVDADGIVQPMQPFRLVNDFANMLSNEEQQQLETKLLDYNDSTSTQIYIVTIDSLNDYAVEDYALRLGRSWAIGQKEKDNGVLILLSKSDRKVDIEIGYGLESYISDYDTKHIIDELIIPAFKDSNYYTGLDNATNNLIYLAQGTYTNENTTTESDTTKPISTIWIILFIILVIYLMYKFPIATRIAFLLLSSGGSSRGSSRGFGGGGGGSFGGGGSSGSW